jgi:DNA-binding NarL/FixJ family response regulator
MSNSVTQARPRRIRMVVVEPYALVRAALRGMVSWEQDIEIVAEVADIDAAIAVVRDDPADVVLVNAELAGPDLVAGLQRLKRECPGSGVILLGHQRDDDELFRALAAGASAHLLESVRPTVLGATIRAVAGGEYVIDQSVAARPTLARRVLEAFREASLSSQLADGTAPRAPFERLSDRETAILTAISQGMSNKDIAAQFSINPHTVKNLVRAILRKLAVNNRTQAVLAGLRNSLIALPEEPRRPD